MLTGVGLAVIGLMRLGFNFVALRALGEGAAGQLNVALSLAVLLSLPATTAFGSTVMRFMGQALAAGERERAAWIYRATLLATLVVALGVAAVAAAARDAIAPAQQITPPLVLEAAMVAVGYALYLFLRNVLYAADRVSAYAVFEVGGALLFLLAVVALVFAGAGSHLLVAFMVAYVGFGLATLVSTRSLLVLGCPADRRPRLLPLLQFSTIASIGTAASLSVRELAVFAAPRIADLGAAAHLGLSMSLLAPLQMFPRMLRTVIFSHSAALDGSGRQDELGRSLTEANHWLALVAVPACGLVGVLGAPLIEVMGGVATPERLLVFRLLTVAALMEVLATPAANALPGAGHVKAPNYAAIVALVVTAAIWVLAKGELGLVGLALGMVVNSIIKGGVSIWYAWRDLEARPTRAPGRLALLLTLTLAVLAAATFWPHGWLLAGLYAVAVVPLLVAPARELAALLKTRLGRAAT